MRILKFIWDVIQCFIVGIMVIGILLAIGSICLMGFICVLQNIPQIIGQTLVYIILVVILVIIIFSIFGIGNEILKKFKKNY